MTETPIQPSTQMMTRVLLIFNGIGRFIISRIYEKKTYIIHEKELREDGNKITIRENGVQFGKIDNLNNSIYLSLRKSDPYLSRKVFNHEVRNGHECFVGVKNGEIIFYVWTRRYKGRSLDLSRYPIASNKEIHFFSAVTKKEYRGKNIYPAGIQFLEDYYKDMGYEKISCTTLKETNRENISQKALSKINFRDTGKRIVVTKFLFYKKSRQNFTVHFDNVQ